MTLASPVVPESACRVVAVIPGFNEKTSVLRCLGLLRDGNAETSIVFVDDGSTDGTADAVRAQFPGVHIATGDGNLWWSGATNVGVERARQLDATHVLLLNNDCDVPNGTVARLLAASLAIPRLIASAVIWDIDGKAPVSYGGRIGPTGLEYFTEEPPDEICSGVREVDWLPGHAVLVPVEVFDAVGIMDAKRFPQYFGDADFFLRARRAGFRLGVVTATQVRNDRSQTGLKLRTPVRPGNLWAVLTSRRSFMHVPNNVQFFWHHRDMMSVWQFLRRYEPIPVAIGSEALDRLRLRQLLRRVRSRQITTGTKR